jgi:hypothetical protein
MTRTEPELRDRVARLLKNSAIKQGTRQAALIEHAFLFGFIFANEEVNSTAYLQILLLSGRSILDDK